jgi:hypothetical protein
MNAIEGYQPTVPRQSLNLLPAVVVEWDIKLSLYQPLIVTIISSIVDSGKEVLISTTVS